MAYFVEGAQYMPAGRCFRVLIIKNASYSQIILAVTSICFSSQNEVQSSGTNKVWNHQRFNKTHGPYQLLYYNMSLWLVVSLLLEC